MLYHVLLPLLTSLPLEGFNFTKLGIHPGMGATHFLPKIVSPQLANDLLMVWSLCILQALYSKCSPVRQSGALITGEEAKRIGLVRDALPAAEVLSPGCGYLEHVAHLP
jgi:enoyl-CoA hydratase/carnithine racemase